MHMAWVATAQSPHLHPGVLMCSRGRGLQGLGGRNKEKSSSWCQSIAGLCCVSKDSGPCCHCLDADKFCFVTSDNTISTQKSTWPLSLWQGRINGRWGPLTWQTLPPCWIRENESCGGNKADFWSFSWWEALHCCKRISWRINYADYNSTPAGKTYFKQTNNSGCKHGYAT